MTDDRTLLATRALALRLIADRLREADKQNREQITAAFPVKDRAVVWLPLDGEDVEVGHARKDKGTVTANVTAMGELIDWVEANYPHQIEEYAPAPVTRVRPAFVMKLLADAKASGLAVDEKTGEIIPGVTVDTGDPKIVVVAAKTLEGQTALVEALKADPYVLQSLLALPATDPS